MKIPITVSLISSLENHISIKSHCSNKNVRIDIISGLSCLLVGNKNKFQCKVVSVTEKDKKLTIQLHSERDITVINSLFPYQYKDNEISLLIEEKIDKQLYKETESLLEELSRKTGNSTSNILLSLTSFKPGVEGREDLRFVSEKQMVVVNRKIKDILEDQTPRVGDSN